MTISFKNALGIHQQALGLREQRAEVLANNIANADTPGFKARDIVFKAILGNEMSGKGVAEPLKMDVTNGQHLPFGHEGGETALLYRNPSQPSVDGNTVDTQTETAEFMQNTLQFQSSFQFLSGKFKSLTSAIKGE